MLSYTHEKIKSPIFEPTRGGGETANFFTYFHRKITISICFHSDGSVMQRVNRNKSPSLGVFFILLFFFLFLFFLRLFHERTHEGSADWFRSVPMSDCFTLVIQIKQSSSHGVYCWNFHETAFTRFGLRVFFFFFVHVITKPIAADYQAIQFWNRCNGMQRVG